MESTTEETKKVTLHENIIGNLRGVRKALMKLGDNITEDEFNALANVNDALLSLGYDVLLEKKVTINK